MNTFRECKLRMSIHGKHQELEINYDHKGILAHWAALNVAEMASDFACRTSLISNFVLSYG